MQRSARRSQQRVSGRRGHHGRLPVRVPRGLDPDAEFYVLRLVARMGIEIIGRAAIELIALPDLAPDDDTQGHRGDASRYPADVAEEGASVVGHAFDGVLNLVAEFAERA